MAKNKKEITPPIRKVTRGRTRSGIDTEINSLYKRLYKGAAFHLSEERKYKKFIRCRQQLTEVVALLDRVEVKFKNVVKARELILAEVKQIETDCPPRSYRKKMTKKRGDLSLILYSALENAKDQKYWVDEIGRLISDGGPLHLRLNQEFGEGAFESLGFPVVYIQQQRWEKSPKDKLKKAARAYCFGQSLIFKNNSLVVTKKFGELRFRELVSKGGYTEYELIEKGMLDSYKPKPLSYIERKKR